MNTLKFELLFCLLVFTCKDINGSTEAFDFSGMVHTLFLGATQTLNFAEDILHTPPLEEVMQFYCANPTTKQFVEVLPNDPNIKSKIDFTKPIGLLTHGWLGDGNMTWTVELADLWITNHDTNVCRINWSRFSEVEYIYAVRHNLQIVGEYASVFLRYFIQQGSSYANMTCMGFSLGAHVCGHIGRISGGNLGLIYGIDPAGPILTVPIVTSTFYRLDPTDAQYVIVLHTSDGGAGVIIQTGHTDFYANLGTVPQKGCMWPFAVETDIPIPIICSHYRGLDIFKRTIVPNNNCNAIQCEDRLEYLRRDCSSVVNKVGFYAKRIPGKFFFTTGRVPDCTGQFW